MLIRRVFFFINLPLECLLQHLGSALQASALRASLPVPYMYLRKMQQMTGTGSFGRECKAICSDGKQG
jgi:hypothetical protein